MVFSEARSRRFSLGSPVSSPLSSVNGFSSAKLNNKAVHSHYISYDMLHLTSARCDAHDLHTTAPGRMSVNVEKRS